MPRNRRSKKRNNEAVKGRCEAEGKGGEVLGAELVPLRDKDCPSADADALLRRDCSRGIRSTGSAISDKIVYRLISSMLLRDGFMENRAKQSRPGSEWRGLTRVAQDPRTQFKARSFIMHKFTSGGFIRTDLCRVSSSNACSIKFTGDLRFVRQFEGTWVRESLFQRPTSSLPRCFIEYL